MPNSVKQTSIAKIPKYLTNLVRNLYKHFATTANTSYPIETGLTGTDGKTRKNIIRFDKQKFYYVHILKAIL